ncbi:hypothetical protein EUX98_g8603 [Antrodiella citrinella]|uniref:Uncharacterized protein n=1 Tax=Antrodiella citrinella TaxID=2447956 RepID=A0A4S4M585_9APHY|nr:hypothetical protein EUX98_g8603 [Antrodiella citrinella]
MSSVTKGRCLVLWYNLIHATSSLKPALTHDLQFSEWIHSALRTWNEPKETPAPEKVVYALENKYTSGKLRLNRMKGADARKVTLLHAAAIELGFHIGFATLVCHVSGRPNRPYVRGSSEAHLVSFDEIEEHSTIIEGFVDIDGSSVVTALARES